MFYYDGKCVERCPTGMFRNYNNGLCVKQCDNEYTFNFGSECSPCTLKYHNYKN